MAVNLPVGIHHPGHHLGVGSQVRGRDVPVGGQEVLNIRGVTPGEAVEFTLTQAGGIALDAALGSAEREIQEGVFPSHKGRERTDFVQVGQRVIADATLVGAAGAIVLDPIAAENLDPAIVHAHRHLDSEFAPGAAEHLAQAVGEVEAVGGPIDEIVDLFKWGQ